MKMKAKFENGDIVKWISPDVNIKASYPEFFPSIEIIKVDNASGYWNYTARNTKRKNVVTTFSSERLFEKIVPVKDWKKRCKR